MVRGAAVCACLVALIGGDGGARPNLVESALSVSQRGASLRVADVVRNVGAHTAPASSTGYYLARVRIGGRAVPGLRPHGSSRGSVAVTLPTAVPTGSYRLRVCADDRGRIRESDERDNCRASTQAVQVTDRTPPTFAGLQRATTCIPGPVGGGTRSSPYSLRWVAATDDVTPSSAIVYDIYQANAAGGENFAVPTYTTQPGATTFLTPLLPDDNTYYFVVRARDEAGNRDTNDVERLAANLCL
jgi:CARDB